MANDKFGISLRFSVSVDGMQLGDWTKCEGLTVEYEVEEYKEGGENEFVHRLPGRAKYQNIKLSRPVDADTLQVMQYLSAVQTNLRRDPGVIELHDGADQPLMKWSLRGVYPVKWTGPTMDLGSNTVAIEALELSHEGFTGEKATP